MVKSFFKRTWLWKFVLQKKVWQLKNPEVYRKQQEEIQFYRKLLKSHSAVNNSIFDVGANMGRKSFIFSRLTKKVVAFEPSPKLYSFLNKRFSGSNVILFNCALGSSASTLNFYITEKDESYNSLNLKHIKTTATIRGIATDENVNCVKVRVEMIEDYIAKFGTPKYIKIDVEGFEYEVLKGLSTPVPILSFEANLPEFKEESIQSLNYLEKISSNKYEFNFALENSFMSQKFISANEARDFLKNSILNYVEIYAMLR